MADKLMHAKVSRRGYTYRGNSLSVSTVVRMTEAQFERTQRVRPPYFVRATPEQVKAAAMVVDLAAVEPPAAANVEAAEKAAAAPKPTPSTSAQPPKK